MRNIALNLKDQSQIPPKFNYF